MTKITQENLAQVIGRSKQTIQTWSLQKRFPHQKANLGSIGIPPGPGRKGSNSDRDRRYSFFEALSIAMFSDILLDNRTLKEARQETIDFMSKLGDLIKQGLRDPSGPGASERLFYLQSMVIDDQGEFQSDTRVLISDRDLTTRIGHLLKFRVLQINVRDLAPQVARLMKAFAEEEAKSKRELEDA